MISSLLKFSGVAVATFAVAALLGVSPAGFGGVGVAQAQDNEEPAPTAQPPALAPEIFRVHQSPGPYGVYNSATVAWRPVDDDSVTCYELQRRVVGAQSWKRAFMGCGSVMAYSVYPLTMGLNYEFRVRAHNPVGPGPWSAIAPEPGTQPKRENLKKAKPVDDLRVKFWISETGKAAVPPRAQAQLFWDAQGVVDGRCGVSTDAIYRYRFYEMGERSADDVRLWYPPTKDDPWVHDQSATSLVITALLPGKKYRFQVRAYSEECGSWSKRATITWTQPLVGDYED